MVYWPVDVVNLMFLTKDSNPPIFQLPNGELPSQLIIHVVDPYFANLHLDYFLHSVNYPLGISSTCSSIYIRNASLYQTECWLKLTLTIPCLSTRRPHDYIYELPCQLLFGSLNLG